MTYKEKLAAIRAQMKENGVDAYIIPSADPHISEYVPEHYKCLRFASGFTGSAGTILITHEFAGLWADFRYFVQATEQLEGTGYELVKLKVQHAPEYISWLHQTLPDGAVVACDQNLLSVLLGELITKELADKNISLKHFDFLSSIWENRPALPVEPAFLISEQFTGESASSKLTRLRAALKQHKAQSTLISSLDDIAWLLNIRGKDVSYNPVVLSFVLIDMESATLFIDAAKLTKEDLLQLEQQGVKVSGYHEIEAALAGLSPNQTVFIDPKRNCFALYQLLPTSVKVVQQINPTTHFKAVKNATEIEHTRLAMVKDGVAMTRFFKWMEKNTGKITITELSAAEQLLAFRAELEGFAGASFNTIGGYKAHGALPHYAATEESNSEILPEGLFLVDSGGQYRYGTTDITRMIAMGNNTDEEKQDYTLVLKGLIDGSSTIYPKGTRGYQIDAICRKPLWDYAINYGHGTGHGVGFFLNVHEGPQVLNPTSVEIEMEEGMITSIEPGIYRPGKHGVRIENLVLTIKQGANEFGEFYAFETLTLALIDTSLIKKDLLENRHITWLNNYHQQVYEKLSTHLTPEESAWLKQKTAAI
ncbi:aminopeptidase P family protein [Mucilaginibacter sp. RS28]|uniref:Aminopeptidase P family protein n=1 Tax=Mucilaginibacter straminoryzae TaxID=2932774 RepID=A0A9X1X1W9_9SPHI|nr:aminopeptidase P family protein [Mucilaginibacter straminoryzae]MCJ8209722.1 aminopeptidase P family protein [Mucilaginibacter straminoryzae]